MPRELIFPAVVMSLAFVFYTLGVFAERAARDLRPWHVLSFWAGLTFDAFGTHLMSALAAAGMKPGFIHSVTGTSAFLLMGGHAMWATWVLAHGSARDRARFNQYSLAVWIVWLVPYLGGMAAGISSGR